MPTINSFRLSVLLVVVVFCLYNRRTEPERGSVRLRRAAVQNWPPVGNYPLPLLDEWTSLVDRTAIPQLNVRKTADEPCASGDPGCTWSCNLCIGPEDVSDCPDKNTIAITFDDGPTQFTPSLLDFLDKNNIKVTFFIIGSQLINDANKATLLRAFQAGHQIASHTWSHRALTTLNNEEVIAEVMWTHEIITSVIGFSPAFIRPPYGDIDNRVRSIIKQLGYTAVIWNYDTNDWKLPSDSTMKISDIADDFQKWISDSTRSKGIIPLEHDLYAQSVQAFEEAFPTIQASNIKLMKVAECLGANPYMGSVINGTVTSKPPTSAGTTTSVPSPASKPSTSSKVGSSSTPVSGKTGSATRETLSMGYFFAAAICCILAAF